MLEPSREPEGTEEPLGCYSETGQPGLSLDDKLRKSPRKLNKDTRMLKQEKR